TRISRRASCASTCSTSAARLPASLYVGMTTSPRSRMPRTPGREGRQQGDEQQREGRQGNGFPDLVRPRVKREVHGAGARGQRDGDEAVVAPQQLAGVAVDRDLPVRIPVLGDEQVTRLRGCGV